jgi:hypothetical protein
MSKPLPAQYNASKSIGVATYRIVKRLPKELKGNCRVLMKSPSF